MSALQARSHSFAVAPVGQTVCQCSLFLPNFVSFIVASHKFKILRSGFMTVSEFVLHIMLIKYLLKRQFLTVKKIKIVKKYVY